MSEIVEFLEARLADDEAIASGAVRWSYGAAEWADGGEPDFIHIARHDPARVLREVAAKRAVMIAADDATSYDMTVEGDRGVGSRNMIEDPYVGDVILRALASAYSDHPDFNSDWAE